MQFSFLIALVAAALPLASAEGINCNGSYLCKKGEFNGVTGTEARELAILLANIDDNRWYNNNQQVVCTRSKICAFLQNTGGAPGRNIKGLRNFIQEHGCKVCGSVPYFFPGSNDVSQGMLTFNYVSNPCNGGGFC